MFPYFGDILGESPTLHGLAYGFCQFVGWLSVVHTYCRSCLLCCLMGGHCMTMLSVHDVLVGLTG